MGDWVDKALCRNHPRLSPDAWFDIKANVPSSDVSTGAQGMQAFAVCRTCPVRQKCDDWMQSKAPHFETIAGKGWWDSDKKFHDADTLVPVLDRRRRIRHKLLREMPSTEVPDIMDSATFAEQTGVCRDTVMHWIANGHVTAHKTSSNQYLFTRAELDRFSSINHGNVRALQGHLRRNEDPCVACARFQKKLEDAAEADPTSEAHRKVWRGRLSQRLTRRKRESTSA